ncbi:MAG TPA: hypothetical protein VJ654_12065 [Noviherbaspirillum sp.]|nr:hypothetical protein [Noviherbaspirillum sp.]
MNMDIQAMVQRQTGFFSAGRRSVATGISTDWRPTRLSQGTRGRGAALPPSPAPDQPVYRAEPQKNAAAQALDRQGYHLLHWTAHAMDYSAVSELATFVQLPRAEELPDRWACVHPGWANDGMATVRRSSDFSIEPVIQYPADIYLVRLGFAHAKGEEHVNIIYRDSYLVK